jgi:hypothetical protein
MQTGIMELLVMIAVQIIGLGIFIGNSKAAQSYTKDILKRMDESLHRIEEKQDKQNQEMAELRERVAVIENTLEIKKSK